MTRSPLFIKSKLIAAAVPLILVGAGIVGALTSYDAKPKAQITTEQSQTTYVKYQGEEGQDALTLLRKYAGVETKHYDFGDLVIAINGTEGNGPKYWSFYVNGKLSDVGAGAYTTKDSDSIEWKLQTL